MFQYWDVDQKQLFVGHFTTGARSMSDYLFTDESISPSIFLSKRVDEEKSINAPLLFGIASCRSLCGSRGFFCMVHEIKCVFVDFLTYRHGHAVFVTRDAFSFTPFSFIFFVLC